MNKDEKSLLDELWQAAGMGDTPEKPSEKAPAAPEIKEAAPAPAKETPAVEAAPVEAAPVEAAPDKKREKKAAKGEKIAKSRAKKESKREEREAKAAESRAKREEKEKEEAAKKAEETKEKKKNIKFLVLYTVLFVVVISGLIGGSYLVSTRIHREMAQNNENLITNESTLKNIQVQNQELKDKNASLEAKNAQLTEQTKDAEELLNSIGDMVEHDQYLAAAQSAYIDRQEETARNLFHSIDREKLSVPNKAYYDILKEKLGL